MTDKPGSYRMTVEAARPGAKPVKRFVPSEIGLTFSQLQQWASEGDEHAKKILGAQVGKPLC